MPSVEVDDETYAVLTRTADRRGTDPGEVIRYLLGLSPGLPAAISCRPRTSVEDTGSRPA